MSDQDIVAYSALAWATRSTWQPKQPRIKKPMIVMMTTISILVLTLQVFTLQHIGKSSNNALFCGEFARFLDPQKPICEVGEGSIKVRGCIDTIKIKYQRDWSEWLHQKEVLNTGAPFDSLFQQRMMNSSNFKWEQGWDEKGFDFATWKGNWNVDWKYAQNSSDSKAEIKELRSRADEVTKYWRLEFAKRKADPNFAYANLPDWGEIETQINYPRRLFQKIELRKFAASVAKQDFGIDHKCSAPMRNDEAFDAETINWWYNTTQDPNNVPLGTRDSEVGEGIWECPFEDRNFQDLTCKIEMPCSVKEWQDWCNDEMQMSLYVVPDMKFFWFVSQMLLGITVTVDIYSHSKLLRHVGLFYKILIMLQIQIAVYVCRVNSQVTAGQNSVIDILMNTAGLYVLNEFDEIFLQLFTPCRTADKDEECMGIIDAMTYEKDRMFALSVSFGHFVYMSVYIIGFMNKFEGYSDDIQNFLNWGPYGYLTIVYLFTVYLVYYWFFYGFAGLKKDLFTCGEHGKTEKSEAGESVSGTDGFKALVDDQEVNDRFLLEKLTQLEEEVNNLETDSGDKVNTAIND